MKTSEVVEAAKRFSKPYRVTEGKKFRLRDVDPRDTGELTSEDKTRAKGGIADGQTGSGGVTGCSVCAGSFGRYC
jgi:hypothetical protein